MNVKQVAARILQRPSFIQHLPFGPIPGGDLVHRLIRSVQWCSLREEPVRAVLAVLALKRALRVAFGGCAPFFPFVARYG
jgi:hypothetical protein